MNDLSKYATSGPLLREKLGLTEAEAERVLERWRRAWPNAARTVELLRQQVQGISHAQAWKGTDRG